MKKVEGGQIDLFRVEVTWSVMGKQYQKMASQSGVSARGERKDSDWTKKQSALCFRSQRKNEEPHKLSLKCGRGNNGDAKVLETSCSCKAG